MWKTLGIGRDLLGEKAVEKCVENMEVVTGL